jgi:CMP-N,N'-diacetyllegionaminic acid synthase
MSANEQTHPDVLAIVPCRRGSKRLPGKNMRSLCGRPLLDYTVVPACCSPVVGNILVTTDDPEVGARAADLGCPVPFMRPAELASDDATTAETVLHALDWYRAANGRDPDILIILQVTSPLRPPKSLETAIELLTKNPTTMAVVGVRQLGVGAEHIYAETGPKAYLDRLPFSSPRPLFIPNGAMYAIRTSTFREELNFMPAQTLAMHFSPQTSVDIDTEDDFLMAEALMSYRLTNAKFPLLS